MVRNEAGVELVANAHRFVSRLAGERFLGYLQSQRAAMTGEVGAHALRLGLHCVELLRTGRISLPVREPDRAYLRSIRRAEVPLAEVLRAIDRAEAELMRLQSDSTVPPQPDRTWVNGWLHRSYTSYWNDRNR